jgi:hypothetical protein
MKAFGIGLLALVALFALGWLLLGNDLAQKKVFAPKYEQLRRETFENSKAYRDGMAQELRSMQFEYLKADDSRKAGLANVIKHKLAGFPEDAIPYDLQQFIKELP